MGFFSPHRLFSESASAPQGFMQSAGKNNSTHLEDFLTLPKCFCRSFLSWKQVTFSKMFFAKWLVCNGTLHVRKFSSFFFSLLKLLQKQCFQPQCMGFSPPGDLRCRSESVETRRRWRRRWVCAPDRSEGHRWPGSSCPPCKRLQTPAPESRRGTTELQRGEATKP